MRFSNPCTSVECGWVCGGEMGSPLHCLMTHTNYLRSAFLYSLNSDFSRGFYPARPSRTSHASKGKSQIPQLSSQTLFSGTSISLHFWPYAHSTLSRLSILSWLPFLAPITDPGTWFFLSFPPWCSFRTLVPYAQCFINSTSRHKFPLKSRVSCHSFTRNIYFIYIKSQLK